MFDTLLDQTKILDAISPNWRWVKALVLAFPVPPNPPVHGVVYPVNCWESNTIDRAIDIFKNNLNHFVLLGRMTSWGPTFLMSYRLDQLFDKGPWGASLQTYCASTSYATFETRRTNIVTADRAMLEGFREITSSCHPGSHLSAPRAPHLTAFMQLGNAHEENFRLVAPDAAERMFPEVDFSVNEEAENIFRYLSVERTFGYRREHAFSHLSSEVARAAVGMEVNGDISREIASRFIKEKEDKLAARNYVERVGLLNGLALINF